MNKEKLLKYIAQEKENEEAYIKKLFKAGFKYNSVSISYTRGVWDTLHDLECELRFEE